MQTETVVAQTPTNYAANPEALANMTDDQIDALANLPAAESPPVEGDTKSSEAPAAANQAPAVAMPAVNADVEQPKGVQAKDGDHVIPYSVLERERDRATRAEQTAQALAEQLKQLQAGTKPGAEGGESNAATLTQEDLAQLDQDLPGVSKLIRSQMSMIEKLSGKVQTLENEQEVQTQNRQQSQEDVIEAALLANPDLKAWRDAMTSTENPDPLMWNRAADLDAVLREDPAWRDKPVAERFAKVAESVKALYGAPSAAKTDAPTDTPATLKAKADAAIAAAGGTAPIPRSSSDIPGGTAPPTDEAAAMLGKSPAQLQAEFMAMTPEQIEARLSRL